MHRNLGLLPTRFLEYLKDGPVVIVQIEHIHAVDNIESILSVDDVDGYILGPYDLSGSMGIPGQFDAPEFRDAIEKVKITAERIGKPGGIHVIEPNPEELGQRINEGFKFIAYSLDIRMLDASSRLACNHVRDIVN